MRAKFYALLETVLRALFYMLILLSDVCYALRVLGALYRSSRDLVMGRVQRTRTTTTFRALLTDRSDVVDAFVNLLTCV
jgi:hypothetical protein